MVKGDSSLESLGSKCKAMAIAIGNIYAKTSDTYQGLRPRDVARGCNRSRSIEAGALAAAAHVDNSLQILKGLVANPCLV